MKKQHTLFVALFSFLFFTFCESTPKKKTATKEVEAPAVEQKISDLPISIDGLIDAYLLVKNALAKDNNAVATEAGKQVDRISKELTIENLKEEANTSLTQIKELSSKLITDDIKEQRVTFEQIGKNLIALIETTGTDKKLYRQFCPMFGEGGVWLSDTKEIFNPLFGSKMLKCGVTQEEIN